LIKVLFVCSGNREGSPSPVIANQANSLRAAGCDIEYFLITQPGLRGYFSASKQLRRVLKSKSFHLVHAHGISSLTATLARPKTLVVSLLGSEVLGNSIMRFVYSFLSRFIWSYTIVKSQQLANRISIWGNKKIYVIPNGVDVSAFSPADKQTSAKQVGFSTVKPTLLFMANPSRQSKNYQLVARSLELIDSSSFELKIEYNVSPQLVPVYLNAASVVLVSSLWEGSPNIVKEAMACCTPIVSTKVGDVEWLIGNCKGCYLTKFNPHDYAKAIEEALTFSHLHRKTNGRERIIELGLNSEKISEKIIDIYRTAIEKANDN
jgi:glycosyltransferase involved in cell wall biosynthesis